MQIQAEACAWPELQILRGKTRIDCERSNCLFNSLCFLTLLLCQVQAQPLNAGSINANSTKVVVKVGDTLWSIATAKYGQPRYFALVAEYNHIESDTIWPGQVVRLPRLSEIVLSFDTLRRYRQPMTRMVTAKTILDKYFEADCEAQGERLREQRRRELTQNQELLLRVIKLLKSANSEMERSTSSLKIRPTKLIDCLNSLVSLCRDRVGKQYAVDLFTRLARSEMAFAFQYLLEWQQVLAGERSSEILENRPMFPL